MLDVAQAPQPILDKDTSHRDQTGLLNHWTDFKPHDKIPSSHPWISRHHDSAILHNIQGFDLISTTDREVYGKDGHPIAFRIGNGGAGWTGVIRALCEKFIEGHGGDFRVGWVVNHSRHSQTALLADVVQVALTYEPEIEELAVGEGWCRRMCAPAFWDHFVLVGPRTNPAGIALGSSSTQALQCISQHATLFHTRGDGSATHEKEQKLWREAGVDVTSAAWLQVRASTPYEALEMAAKESAYLLTDRGTFLTAKRDGVIANLSVHVEREEVLLNPCSALINTRVPVTDGQKIAIRFAAWLGEEDAQKILRGYGRDWEQKMPLFTERTRRDFMDAELLSGGAI